LDDKQLLIRFNTDSNDLHLVGKKPCNMENRFDSLLEAYFAGTLTQAEQEEMKALMAANPDFAAEFAWQQSVARAILAGTKKDTAYLKLKELEHRFRFRRVIIQISTIAATVVLLISAIWFFNRNDFSKNKNQILTPQDTVQQQPSRPQASVPQTLDSQNIATTKENHGTNKPKQVQNPLQKDVVANFRHFKNITRYDNAGSTDEKDSLAVKAYRYYNDSAYHQAAQVFRRMVEADTSNMENRFYYGICLLADQQFAAAAEAFQMVTEKQTTYQTPAKFYLGLACTGAGQVKKARQAFESYLAAPRDNRQFKDLTKEMLKKLPN
jgi:hypothetical protein